MLDTDMSAFLDRVDPFLNRDYEAFAKQELQSLNSGWAGANFLLIQLFLISLQRCGQAGLVEQIGRMVLEASAKNDPWENELIKLTLGQVDPGRVLASAGNEAQRNQALYYSGARLLTAGRTVAARKMFGSCATSDPALVSCFEQILAAYELQFPANVPLHRIPANDPIHLPNVEAEHLCIPRLVCESCGHLVQAERLGSRPASDGRIHDVWEIKCQGCDLLTQIVLSVPGPSIYAIRTGLGSRPQPLPVNGPFSRQIAGIDGVARLNKQAMESLEQERTEEVIDLATRARDRSREHLGDKHPVHADSLNILARAYQAKGESHAAKPLFEQAAEIYRAAMGESSLVYANTLDKLAMLSEQIGTPSETVSLLRRVVEILRENPEAGLTEFASRLSWLAKLYCSQRDYAAAEPLLKEALEIRRKALGEGHPEYAANLDSLGRLYCETGDYAAARPLQEQALKIHRKTLGEDNENYATSLNNLASLYRDMGNYAAAEPLQRRCMEILCAKLGEEHPLSIGSVNNLATLYVEVGNYAAAEPLLKQALALRRKALGEDDPDYAHSLANLANIYADTGRYPEARPLLEGAVEIHRATLGEDHPDYAQSLNNLAMLHKEMGNHSAAEPLMKQSLAIDHKALGEGHPSYANGLNNLAALYSAMGRYAAAEPLHQQAREIIRRTHGEAHPNYATSLSNLANLYLHMGNYAAAESLMEQVREILRKALGEDHPKYATSLNSLAVLYYEIGRYNAAEPIFQRALEIRRKAFGKNHPLCASSLSGLAALYTSMSDYVAALPLLQEAVDVSRTASGEDHPSYARCLNHLAELYDHMGDDRAAIPLRLKALGIIDKALGREHPNFADCLSSLADLRERIGNHEAAEALHLEVLEIRLRALGEAHPQVALGLNSLACLYLYRGDDAEAEPLLKQALRILLRSSSENQKDLAAILNNLARLYERTGNYAAAEWHFRQALGSVQAALGEEHPLFGALLNNLALLHVRTRRAPEALPLIERAAAIDDKMIGQIFAIGSERQRMVYLDQIRVHLAGFLSIVTRHLSDSLEATRAALDLVLRRKGIGFEALAARRDAVLGGKYPTLVAPLREWVALKAQITRKSLDGAGPGGAQAHRELLTQWRDRADRLEGELVRQIPEMALEQKLRAADRRAVALSLPQGIALIEFIRFDVLDFEAASDRGESPWKSARYLAFVLTAEEPDAIRMIDLGEAEPIDRMIAEFRQGIINGAEDQDERDVVRDVVKCLERSASAADVGPALRASLFDPLVPALGGRKRLLLAPDGNLTRLPFEVLPLGRRRLIDDYAISYLSCGRDVLRFGIASTGLSSEAIAIGDPDFDLEAASPQPQVPAARAAISPKPRVWFWSRLFRRGPSATVAEDQPAPPSELIAPPHQRRSRSLGPGAFHFKRLPDTRIEARGIAELLKVEPWLGGAALEGRLKERCRSPRILHLATHGFFLTDQEGEPGRRARDQNSESMYFDTTARLSGPLPENPLLRSGLALAGANTWLNSGSLPADAEDGLLTAEDVSGLNLFTTELVVLSACETGLGEIHIGEGVFGLRRAFASAGAKTLIMSLWKVPDTQSRELMVDFYRRILGGRPRAEALRDAQLALKVHHPNPYYWGAFICQGEPAPLGGPDGM